MSKPDVPAVDPLPTHSHVMCALYQLDDYDTENGIPATVIVEHVVDLTGLSSADVRDSLEFLHLNGEIYEREADHFRRTLQNDERWENFEIVCRWQESLAEARMAIGRGLRPRELVSRYDVEDPDRIGELVTRATLEVHHDENGKLTPDDLDKAAERMEISRIVTDGGWEHFDPDPPALESFDPWKLPQPDDGIVYLYQAAVDKHWRIINDEDAALEEATGYPVEELLEHEEMGDYTDSESGEFRAIYVPSKCPECTPVATDGGVSSSGTERKTVGLEVQYGSSSEPCEIEFFHNTFGMMKFEVNGRTAVIDPEWHQIGDGFLKEEYDRWITTGDVIHSVQQLPFIDEVDATKVREHYIEAVTEQEADRDD